MKRHPGVKMAKFWLQYGGFILPALAGYQFYLFYLAYSAGDWLGVAVHLFAGLVALGVGLWVIKLRWFTKED